MPDWANLAKQGLEMYQDHKNKSHGSTPQPEQSGQNQGYGGSSTPNTSQAGYGSSTATQGGYGGQSPGYSGQTNSGSSGGAAQEYFNQSSGGSGGYGGSAQPARQQQYGQNLGTGNEVYNKPLDHDQVIQEASQHTGSSQDSGLFAAALQHVSQSGGTTPSLDHQSVEAAHDQAYRQGKAGSMDAHSMGSAAAMQAFKMFAGGKSSSGSSGSSGGSSQSQLISLAMSEAVKLFDKSGGSASGGKQDAVNGAVKTVMKLILQSKSGAGGGSGGSAAGGPDLSSLMGLASKFL